jgi:hypothetical protein
MSVIIGICAVCAALQTPHPSAAKPAVPQEVCVVADQTRAKRVVLTFLKNRKVVRIVSKDAGIDIRICVGAGWLQKHGIDRVELCDESEHHSRRTAPYISDALQEAKEKGTGYIRMSLTGTALDPEQSH